MSTATLKPPPLSQRPQRIMVAVAISAGLAWLILGIESILRPEPETYRDAAFLLPWTLTLITLAAIHRHQRHALGRFGRISFGILVASMVAAIVLSASLLVGELTRHFIYVVPAWVLAMAAYGAATARAGLLPRWAGIGIALSEPITIATGVALSPLVPLSESGSFSGAVAHGVIFLAIARTLSNRF